MNSGTHCVVFALRVLEPDDDGTNIRTVIDRALAKVTFDKMPEFSVSPDGMLIAIPDTDGSTARSLLRQIQEFARHAGVCLSGAIAMGRLDPVRKKWLADNFEGEAAIAASRILVETAPEGLGIVSDTFRIIQDALVGVKINEVVFPGKRGEKFPGYLVERFFAAAARSDVPMVVEKGLLSTYVDREPRFEFRARRINSHDEALAGSSGEEGMPAAEVLKMATHFVWIQARGGSGKSAFLSDLGKAGIDNGAVTFLIMLTGAPKEPKDLFVVPRLGNATGFHEACTTGKNTLLLADGLERLDQAGAEAALALLRSLLEQYKNLRVVVTDRIVQRSLRGAEQRWTVNPLDQPTIKAYAAGGEDFPIFESPFFLNLWINEKDRKIESPLRAEMILRYLDKHAGVPAESIPDLGAAAFAAYVEFGGPDFATAWWQTRVNEPIRSSLARAGIVEPSEPGKLRFFHQLFHDALVGCHLARMSPSKWTGDTFDAATLNGRIFEPLVFACERMGGVADEFIIRVYDWSYVNAFRCVADLAKNAPAGLVSRGLILALTALQAEKLFDPFLETRRGAKERLAKTFGFGSELAKQFLKAERLEDVLQIVEGQGVEDAWTKWKELFLRNPGQLTALKPDELGLIADGPIIGWTAANVFRRPTLRIDEACEERLKDIYVNAVASNDPPTRWRIVHTFGRCGTVSARDFLVGSSTSDTYQWVRYGAVRSLIEIAAASAELRDVALEHIVQLIGSKLDVKVLDEIGRTAMVDNPAPGWPAAILPVLEKALDLVAENDERRKDWERWHSEVRKQVARDSSPQIG